MFPRTNTPDNMSSISYSVPVLFSILDPSWHIDAITLHASRSAISYWTIRRFASSKVLCGKLRLFVLLRRFAEDEISDFLRDDESRENIGV